MAVVNMSSLLPKLNAYVESAQGKQDINLAIREMTFSISTTRGSGGRSSGIRHSPDEIAAKFISTMLESARSAQGASARGGVLGSTAIDAISNFVAGTPAVLEAGEMTVITIPFNFEGNLHRDSLCPAKYNGVDNIVALLNNGYSAGATVYGSWHGQDIYSLKQRSGTRFIQTAVRQFWDRYASEYNIINIEISDEYN